MLLLATGGCSLGNLSLSTAHPILQFNFYDVPGNRPDIFLSGGLRGTLKREGQCVFVRSSAGKVTPLWPVGTKITSVKRGFVIELPDNRGSVQLDRPVRLSGSAPSKDDESRLLSSAVQACPGSYFFVSGVDK
jgi:hypothetical protein